jgi:hypothetical protein
MLFGYEAVLDIVAPTELRGAQLPAGTRPPAVFLAMSTSVPGVDPGGHAVRALADATCRRGYPAGVPAADRAFNNSVPETFQLPVRELGFTPLYDYPRHALGVQEPGPGGAMLLEGSWACPHTPAELKDATLTLHRQTDAAERLAPADARKAREQARKDWVERITAWTAALRQDGALHEIKGPDGDIVSYQVAELTGVRDLTGWPDGMRLTVRRVKPSRRDAKKLTAFEKRTGWRCQGTLFTVITPRLRTASRRSNGSASGCCPRSPGR